jgi:hypothetical protein
VQIFINEITNGGYKPGTISLFYGLKKSGKTTVQVAIANALAKEKKTILLLTADIKASPLRQITAGDQVTVKDRGENKWTEQEINSFLIEKSYDCVLIDDVYLCVDDVGYALKRIAVKHNIPIVASYQSGYENLSVDEVIDLVYNETDHYLKKMPDLIVYQELKEDKILMKPVKNKWDNYKHYTLSLSDLGI